jgi:hypothetical protein
MKNVTKGLIAGAAALALMGGLTGCNPGSSREGYNDEGFSVEILQGPNETSITCVLYDGYDGDTIDCDFGAR